MLPGLPVIAPAAGISLGAGGVGCGRWWLSTVGGGTVSDLMNSLAWGRSSWASGELRGGMGPPLFGSSSINLCIRACSAWSVCGRLASTFARRSLSPFGQSVGLLEATLV